jgi:APA family basic amino acid/polyamine antiporter
MGYGTKMEPLLALGIAMVWAIYGGIYFIRASRVSGKAAFATARSGAA